jgi:integrase
MPWRKYKPKSGKYGSIYCISKGVQVRCDARGKWTIFIERGDERKNKTIGAGRESLVKAIKVAENIASQVGSIHPTQPAEQPKQEAPMFKEISEEWLEDGSGRWDLHTYCRYENMLRLHIWPHESFRSKRVNDVTRGDVKRCLSTLLKIRAPATVELCHTVLNGIFQEAIDSKFIESNPGSGLLKKLLPPKKKRNIKEPDPFDMGEKDRFLDHAEKTCSWTEELILKVMVYAGLRLGETLAMRLRHLDLKKMTYHVSESFKQHRFGLPKGGKKRFVDIPDFLVEELGRYIVYLKKESLQRGQGGDVDLLFPDPKECGYCPYSQRKVQGIVKRICNGAKLRMRNPHDLRHTYASILLMANRSPAYVMEQLGHSSIKITVDIYGHWIPGRGREGLEDALLGGVQKPHIIAYKQERSQ